MALGFETSRCLIFSKILLLMERNLPLGAAETEREPKIREAVRSFFMT
jgi:hypothetical protein